MTHLPTFAYNFMGVAGGLLILLGFYRTSIGRWKTKSFLYELDNAFGAVLLVIYQYHLHAYISVVLNLIWLVVAFRGITSFAERYIKKSQRKKTKKPTRR